MSKRSRIVGFGSAALLVVVGIGCAFAFSGGLGQNLAFGLVALGLIEGTALAFYEVGLTEDRDRDREQHAREAAADSRQDGPADDDGHPLARPRAPGPRDPDHPDRLSRPRTGLDRMRGRPRRLR